MNRFSGGNSTQPFPPKDYQNISITFPSQWSHTDPNAV